MYSVLRNIYIFGALFYLRVHSGFRVLEIFLCRPSAVPQNRISETWYRCHFCLSFTRKRALIVFGVHRKLQYVPVTGVTSPETCFPAEMGRLVSARLHRPPPRL